MWKRITYLFLLLLMGGVSAFALDPPSLPPRTPVLVGATIPIRFGNFTIFPNTSGTVTLSPTGLRTSDGGVYLMGGTVQPAQFEFRLMPGRTVYVHPVINQTSVKGFTNKETIVFQNPKFELEGGEVEVLANGIRFKSHVGSNRIHRLKMGGQLKIDGLAKPSDTFEGTVDIIIEAY